MRELITTNRALFVFSTIQKNINIIYIVHIFKINFVHITLSIYTIQ